MEKVKAMICSLQDWDYVTIISEKDCNNVIAEYKDKKYSAIYNCFVGRYYVDDVYGEYPKGDE